MAELEKIISQLKNQKSFMENVSRWETIAAQKGVSAGLPEKLRPELAAALKSTGIEKLYSHQAECFKHAAAGENITVVTPTASGKTLCYNLPVLQRLLENPDARAVYIFPTKALAQDQQSALNELVLKPGLGIKAATYDGDTPSSLRLAVRDSGRIIITNPDMLHSGILPNHTKWARFFMNLEFIVIDEVHTYRGVFGSHMANVLRRLKRIAAHYGSSPGFICCSATIGNPAELASKVTEEKTLLVSGNGAPSGEKHLVFYNPPLVDRVQGLRRSSALEAGSLAFMLIKEKIKTIVFARSRIRVELIASYLKDSVRNIYTDNSRTRIESYRGGYLPSERRKIEQGLRSGEVTGVVSTNALELGIDIGSLDAAVLAGFPGSISSAWQQAGRAGRRNSVSLAVLVSSASPLDQFYVTHPEYFLATPPEAGFIDPDNIYILTDHVKCAAFELPFKEGESFGCDISSILAYLEEEGVLRKSAGSWYWSDRGYPSENISLRSAAAENIIIIDTTKGRYEPIGEMDYLSARELIFDNAVYMHRSCQYIVKKLDLAEKKCLVEETDVDYFTDSIVKTDIKVLETDNDKTSGLHRAVTADILLRSQVSKFKKLKFRTHENLGYGEIHLPEAEMHTRALALVFGKETTAYRGLSEVPDEGKALVLSQAAKLLKTVSSIYLLCDAADMGSAERVKDPHFKETVLYFYDNHPGGIGLAEAMAAIIPQVLEAALSVIETCPCEAGCPSCTGPADELPSTVPNPKAAVHAFLKIWLKGA